MGKKIEKLIGAKADRDRLTKALDDSADIRHEGPAYEKNQAEIRAAEAKLPPLGRFIGRDRSHTR